MKKFILVLLLLILVGGLLSFFFLPDYLNMTYNTEDEVIEVEPGDSLSVVSRKLYDEGIIKSKTWLTYKGKDIARKIKPGTYVISKDSSIYDVFELIQKGEKQAPIVATFPEGFILYQFANKVEELGLGSKDAFLKETEDYYDKNLNDEFSNDNLFFSMEGYLFPETYYFLKNQSLGEIVDTLYKTGLSAWDDEMVDKLSESKYTKHEILTIASLIEREAYNDKERQTISGVIYNRLKKGMPLQIDASVIYGIGQGREHMTKVLFKDLESNNPYNTYVIKGIPPGPISNPGKKSIYASLFPQDHDYLYYVMGEDGHVFAKTFEEHKINADKYRKSQ